MSSNRGHAAWYVAMLAAAPAASPLVAASSAQAEVINLVCRGAEPSIYSSYWVDLDKGTITAATFFHEKVSGHMETYTVEVTLAAFKWTTDVGSTGMIDRVTGAGIF